MKWVWNDKNTPLECQHWNSYAGIPTWSPLVILGRHGDLKWRPLMGSSVAMATKWRPNGHHSHVGIPMLSPFASVGRHGDLKWRTFDAVQFPLSPWRPCGDFSCSNSENALFHLFVSLFAPNSSSFSQMPLSSNKTWNTWFNDIKYGETPENQA